jgi:hypothetical protein
MFETWYVMEDGSCGDPREIKRDADGKLVHRDGRKVAYAPHGPRSRSVDAEAERGASKNMRPQQTGKGYLTRESSSERTEPDADLVAARAEYQQAFGKRAYAGWDASTLREKIAEQAKPGAEDEPAATKE